MTDQERLAEYANDIRDNLSEIIDILSEKEYLAERVENLEKENAIVSIHLRENQVENQRYKKALGFYADKKNYDDIGIPTPNGEIVTPIMEDGGEIARQELEEIERLNKLQLK